jgi:hypothetical protein
LAVVDSYPVNQGDAGGGCVVMMAGNPARSSPLIDEFNRQTSN